jgi:hypothetical protein
MDDQQILSDLHDAIERLADAMNDQPPVSRALRRFADQLPSTRPGLRRRLAARMPRNPSAIRPLLWRALDDGVLDAKRFDAAMLMRARAERSLESRRYSPPAPIGSPSVSKSSTGPGRG